MNANAGTLGQLDVRRGDPTADVEEGYETTVALVIGCLGEEDGVADLDARFLEYFAP
jgi:hypothetical protein